MNFNCSELLQTIIGLATLIVTGLAAYLGAWFTHFYDRKKQNESDYQRYRSLVIATSATAKMQADEIDLVIHRIQESQDALKKPAPNNKIKSIFFVGQLSSVSELIKGWLSLKAESCYYYRLLCFEVYIKAAKEGIEILYTQPLASWWSEGGILPNHQDEFFESTDRLLNILREVSQKSRDLQKETQALHNSLGVGDIISLSALS